MQGMQMNPQQMQWYSAQQAQLQQQMQAQYMQNFFAAQQAAAASGAGGSAAGGGSPYGAGSNSPMYGGHPGHMGGMRGGPGAGGMMIPQDHDPEAYVSPPSPPRTIAVLQCRKASAISPAAADAVAAFFSMVVRVALLPSEFWFLLRRWLSLCQARVSRSPHSRRFIRL